MSWCDKLASTAGVGFKFDVHYAPSNGLIAAVSPILDRIHQGEKPNFSLESAEAFAIKFSTDDGFQYGLDHSRAYVEFMHRMRIRNVSAGPPIAELLSRPLPYTQLLPEVSARLIEVSVRLPEIKERNLVRVGIISTTTVAADEAPPGITRMINYLGRPWQQTLDAFNFRVVGRLGESATTKERCVHHILKSDDEDGILTLKFDWQREFKNGRRVDKSSLQEVTAEAIKDANRYFEELAIGNRFDENLLSSAA